MKLQWIKGELQMGAWTPVLDLPSSQRPSPEGANEKPDCVNV